jgi:hypothetical protein
MGWSLDVLNVQRRKLDHHLNFGQALEDPRLDEKPGSPLKADSKTVT